MTEFERAALQLWRDHRCDTSMIAAMLSRQGFFLEASQRRPITEAHVYNTLSRLRERARVDA